ncbi:MAG TPA: glycosyltransferase [Vicinamibacterales bacterium]|nr:glycosyltransferase [Vicinamibacterales bacterium]
MTSRRLRILICIESLGIGGKERQAVELVKGLVRRPGIECAVICLERDDFYLHELATAVSLEFIPRRRRWDPAIFPKLFGFMKRYRPDVVHTNGLMSSFYMLPAARALRVPLINGSIRNAFAGGGFRWTLEKTLLHASSYRVANSYAGLRSRGLSDRDARNVVIYNGFDFTRLERATPHPAGEGKKVKTVGMVAEFNRYKDYPTFIQMAREVSGRRNDVTFALVGDGSTLADSQRAAAGVEAIRFLGKRKNVEEIVATFDVGVLCTFVEGLSNSIMEYMALGRPVVATDGGGTRELVVDGETGFLVPPSNVDALAARIEYLLDHPTVATRMGEAGEARLRREFSIARMVEETVGLYNVALGGSSGLTLRDSVCQPRVHS